MKLKLQLQLQNLEQCSFEVKVFFDTPHKTIQRLGRIQED